MQILVTVWQWYWTIISFLVSLLVMVGIVQVITEKLGEEWCSKSVFLSIIPYVLLLDYLFIRFGLGCFQRPWSFIIISLLSAALAAVFGLGTILVARALQMIQGRGVV